MSEIENRDSTGTPVSVHTDEYDFNPDVGMEAAVRFLKAKVKVLQEDSSKLLDYNHELIAENASLNTKVREFQQSEKNNQRLILGQQQQIEQIKQKYEETKIHALRLENECSSLQRDLNIVKQTQKQASSTHNSVEIRLNRALNQINGYKQQLQKTQQSSKEVSIEDKRKIDELKLENKRLLKQKNELLLGFKKQMRLIDILRRQKMHLEAARVLQFSEEEFMKIVDWKS